MTHSLKVTLQASAVLLASVFTTACNRADDPGLEYAPEMYYPIPYEPLKQLSSNKVNPMGLNMRTPAIGTVPRGKANYYTHIAKDDIATAETTLRNPYAYTKDALEEGKTLYVRNCQHCHGESGAGDGPVGAKFKGVPNYSVGAYKTMNDGHIYHVIQWGKGRMMPHGSQVNPQERWKIAMYVRMLQQGKGPDGMTDFLKASGVTNAAVADSSQTTDQQNQSPVQEAQADKASQTPGQGDKARNGTAL
ncbi:mono/diheme cytochrome c family protein [Hymenobacter luteus]|uniref:Mono/diheme cytochrome c family protein n=2 Tax=Hymenobacter TaxID=89966 RepID=A0A7W9SYI2_9BACT|nr:cytochrome c [Hymenobacter latericoloratus]MBB4600372.1 mono/diheme cytochrome c family protein [Hymenobacter latericoloratus]MBB6057318.1 mono/diheme cytochrome c family protein [Hymenobacter luteus]